MTRSCHASRTYARNRCITECVQLCTPLPSCKEDTRSMYHRMFTLCTLLSCMYFTVILQYVLYFTVLYCTVLQYVLHCMYLILPKYLSKAQCRNALTILRRTHLFLVWHRNLRTPWCSACYCPLVWRPSCCLWHVDCRGWYGMPHHTADCLVGHPAGHEANEQKEWVIWLLSGSPSCRTWSKCHWSCASGLQFVMLTRHEHGHCSVLGNARLPRSVRMGVLITVCDPSLLSVTHLA